MNPTLVAALARLLLLLALLLPTGRFSLLAPDEALALELSFTTRPDNDNLSFVFATPGAFPTVTRTGPRELSLARPPGAARETLSDKRIDFRQSRFIEDVRQADGGLSVRLKTDQFGYVAWPEGENALKIQIYRDPQGANWRPPARTEGAEAAPSPDTAKPAVEAAPVRQRIEPPRASTPPDPTPRKAELPELPTLEALVAETAAPAPPGAPVSPPGGAGTSPTRPAGQAGPDPAAGPKEPFFAVGHSLRAPIQPGGPDRAQVIRPGGPLPGAPGVARFAVSDKVAATAGDTAAPAAPAVRLPPIPAEVADGGARGAVTRTPPGDAAGGRVSPTGQATAVSGPTATPGVPGEAASPPSPGATASGSGEAGAPVSSKETALADPLGQGESAPPPDEPTQDEDYELLVTAQADKINGNYQMARETLEFLKNKPEMSRELREEVLYTLAEVYFDMYKAKLMDNTDQVQGALLEAINFNGRSHRVPGGLLLLGLMNLRWGNIPEATGYFNVLARKYPTDENVPLIYFYWGEYYYDRGDFARAAKEYQTLVEKYPESRFVREGSMGLAKSFVKLDRYKDASEIADYIDKRWPRYYVEFPPILRIGGDIAYRLGDVKRAKDLYLAFLNLDPKGKDMDLVWTRLGDIYSRLGQRETALEFYGQVAKTAPDSQGGLIARMRLAEAGVHDEPTISEMFAAFKRPEVLGPADIYTQIIRDHPDSPLAPLALLKLAMWRLYKENYLEALGDAESFLAKYPDHELRPKALEVALASFDKIADTLAKDQNYVRVLDIWKSHPILAENAAGLDPRTRVAVAMSSLRTGDPDQAIRLALPLIGEKQTEPGTMALMVALSISLESNAWQAVVDLARKVSDWRFTPDQRQQVEFAAAMALENLGEASRSRPLWTKLASESRLAPFRRAYAMYYLARDNMIKKDLEKAEIYAGEAAMLFKETGRDPEKHKDSLNMLIEASTGLGQYPQVVKWAEEYGRHVTEGGPDWARNRFRIAAAFKNMGQGEKWRAILEETRTKAPGTVYAQMAASELAAGALTNRAENLTRPN